MKPTPTCDSQRIDDSRDGQVGHGQVGDESPAGAVAGGPGPTPAASPLLDGQHGDDDEVAERSDDRRDAEHGDVRRRHGRCPVIQRPSAADRRRLRAVPLRHPDERKLHDLRRRSRSAPRLRIYPPSASETSTIQPTKHAKGTAVPGGKKRKERDRAVGQRENHRKARDRKAIHSFAECRERYGVKTHSADVNEAVSTFTM